MKAAAWIAWRELTSRPAALVLAVVTISVAVAVCAATELVHRSREVAVSAQIDAMGAGLHLLPKGHTSRDLVRFELGTDTLDEGVVGSVRRELSGQARAVEGRLLLKLPLAGEATPIMGLDPSETSAQGLSGLAPGQVALGAELGRRLGISWGELDFMGRTFEVTAVLESSASADDLALAMRLDDLQAVTGQAGAVNEIRVFALPGVSPAGLAAGLRVEFPDLAVTVPDNDDSTRVAVDESLSGLRWILYLVTATVAAFCVLVWSNLNASERRVEMATLVAIGGSSATVFRVLALRVGFIALVGAILGNALAIGIALFLDFDSARSIVWSGELLLLWPAASALLALAGALPVTLLSARREHVWDLQA